MASPNQDAQQRSDLDRARARRLAWLVVIGFMLIAWGPRTAMMLERGWSSSALALERQQQIDESARRIEILQREVAYAHTAEGKDVEAKRRFGVGPQDEIWITVEAEVAREKPPLPRSVADRVESWLTDGGGRVIDRIREVGTVLSYAVGLTEVDQCIILPVIEDLEPEQAAPEEEVEPSAPADEITGEGGSSDDDVQ